MGKKKMNKTLKAVLIILGVILALILVLFVWAFVTYNDSSDENMEEANQKSAGEASLSAEADVDSTVSTQGITKAQTPANAAVSPREHYVDTDTAESVTVMVYMIGSDLESEAGAASLNLGKMADATLDDDVNIIIETGGCEEWQTEGIEGGINQRWIIDSEGWSALGDYGTDSMGDPETLSDFIAWTGDNFEADRNILILWDHGGGLLGGYGKDTMHNDEGMEICDLPEVLDEGGVQFDMIGFDACIMGTAEIAYALEPYADYLVASEEEIPGEGWYYTDFLSELSKTPNMSTAELGKTIIDDYDDLYKDTDESVTLSLVDLAYMPVVYSEISDFFSDAKTEIEGNNDEFTTLSKARNDATEYADNEFDQVDIIDFVSRTDFEGRDELVNAVNDCVVYKNNSTIAGSNGLAMYFPYRQLDYYYSATLLLRDIGFTEPLDSYDYFASILSNGQSVNPSSNGIMSNSSGDDNTQNDSHQGEDSWYDGAADNVDYTEYPEELELTETDNGYELILSDDEWEDINDCQLSAMYSYEDGYIDLGSDNVLSFSDEGNLIIDFDRTWVCIDGHPAPFHADTNEYTDKGSVSSGYVDAMLNGDTEIRIKLEWDMDSNGSVKGYRLADDNSLTLSKGLTQFKKGDSFDIIYDFYDNDFNYSGSTTADDPIQVTSQDDLVVSYEDFGEGTYVYWGTLTNIYQQTLYTEKLQWVSE